MAKRIVYFTAASVATTAEKADIVELSGIVAPQFELTVYNGAASPNYGAGIADADYVAGTIPTAYSDDNVYPVFNADAPPFVLPAAQAIIADEDVIDIAGTTYTFTVVDNVVTAIVVA